MKHEKYTYLVVENAEDVCEGIERRMSQYHHWDSLGYCTGVKKAMETIQQHRPNLIYLDWSLNGGSAYEVLQFIQNLPEYNPYIIFNTGFQSDNPEIPVEIINKYNVDKYLVKPFWENLRKNLPDYLKEAMEKADQSLPKSKIIWLDDENGSKVSVPVNQVICIVQHPGYPRRRNFYLATSASEIIIRLTWEKCYELLDAYQVSYFITKNREHLVVRDFVEKFDKPFVRLKGLPFKFEVVKEKRREFEAWLTGE